jgi:hypothetical protein
MDGAGGSGGAVQSVIRAAVSLTFGLCRHTESAVRWAALWSRQMLLQFISGRSDSAHKSAQNMGIRVWSVAPRGSEQNRTPLQGDTRANRLRTATIILWASVPTWEPTECARSRERARAFAADPADRLGTQQLLAHLLSALATCPIRTANGISSAAYTSFAFGSALSPKTSKISVA